MGIDSQAIGENDAKLGLAESVNTHALSQNSAFNVQVEVRSTLDWLAEDLTQ